MNKNRVFALIASLFLFLSLCSCSSYSSTAQNGASTDSASSAGGSTSYTFAKEEIAPEAKPNTSSSNGNVIPKDASKMIYRANLNLETTAFPAAVSALSDLVKKTGGYFEQSEQATSSSNYRYASYVVRLPKDHYRPFLDSLGTICHITYQNESVENVSEGYRDVDLRLKTQRTKYDRLYALLQKAEKMEDIISLQNAISEVELQIESLESALRSYDDLINFSTVTIQLSEVPELSYSDQAPVGFGARLWSALKNGFFSAKLFFQNLFVFIAYHLVGLVIFALAIFGVYKVIKMRRRKHEPAKIEVKSVSSEPQEKKEE